MKMPPLFLMAASAFVLSAVSVNAVDRTWIGPSGGGVWETPEYWTGTVLPGEGDRAILGDVASGTREVLLGSEQTIQFLEMTQTTPGALNRLVLDANLNVTSGAGEGNTLFSFSSGTEMVANAGVAFAVTKTAGGVGNPVNANLRLEDGSAFRFVANNGAMQIALNGAVEAEGGAVLVRGNGALLTVGGTTTLTEGSGMRVEVTDTAQSGFTNKGTLTMDASNIHLQWLVTTMSGGVNRRFVNEGSWRLANHSSLTFETMNAIGTGNLNAEGATLRVESGSSVTFRSLDNEGVLIAGSSADGVASDAQVVLGTVLLSHPKVLNNSGTFAVRGDALVGEVATSNRVDRAVTLNNLAGGVMEVGGGDDLVPLTLTLKANGVATFNNAGTATLASNGTLQIQAANNASQHTQALMTNSGTFVHAGRLEFQSNGGSGVRSLTNTGTYRVSGLGAELATLANVQTTGSVPALGFTSTGTLAGSSAHDRLSYVDGTPGGVRPVLAMTLNGGVVSPGGAVGTGVLELVDVNLTLAGTARLELDFANGGFDQLLLTGDAGRVLTLGEASVLNIRLSGEVSAQVPYTIITAGTVEGMFGSLLLNGVASDAYSLTYGSDSVTVSFAAIPEPSSLAMLGVSAVALGLWRRRRRG